MSPSRNKLNILICGIGGFIGRHLYKALHRRGHDIHATYRNNGPIPSSPGDIHWLAADFLNDTHTNDWLERLQGIDVVVNCVGAMQGDLEALHHKTPAALFKAAAAQGCRVVQVSALGAEQAEPISEFLAGKRRADEILRTLDINASIIFPSVVIGRGGNSTEWFSRLAALPWLWLPQAREEKLQAVCIDDLTELLCRCIESRHQGIEEIAAIGPQELSLAQLIQALRHHMGYSPAHIGNLPGNLLPWVGKIGDLIQNPLLSDDALRMLQQGSCADKSAMEARLGRPPHSVSDALAEELQPLLSPQQAAWYWCRPLLLATLVFLWIFTGITSALLWPERGYELLSQAGIQGLWADIGLYSGSILDIVLGLGLLSQRLRSAVLTTQLLVMLGYSAFIGLWLPLQWLEPFGPVTKNLPIIVMTLFLLWERRR